MCREHTTWDDVCDFVAKDILGYPTTRLQRLSYQKLQGVKKGQVIANNKAKIYSSYTDEDLLYTLKLCKATILRGIKNKNIQGELGKVSYACAVCRSYIDGIAKKRANVQKSREIAKQNLEAATNDGELEHTGEEYHFTEEQSNILSQRYKDLW